MRGGQTLPVWIMAAIVVAGVPAAFAQSPTATLIPPSDPDEITVELPKMGSPAVDPRDTADPVAVIPAGQEDLLAEMVGRGATLAGGCTLSGGQVDGPAMTATYACPGGPVVVELVHPDQGAAGSTKTERFAIRVRSGTAPDGLLADLAGSVRAREARFEWKWLGTPGESSWSPPPLVMAAVGAAIVAVLGVLWRARRAR